MKLLQVAKKWPVQFSKTRKINKIYVHRKKKYLIYDIGAIYWKNKEKEGQEGSKRK